MGLHDQDSGKPASEKDGDGFRPAGVEMASDQASLFEGYATIEAGLDEETARSRRRILVERLMFCYSAGQTRRWHTRDHMIRDETIAAHSWNVTMWIMLLHPEPGKNLIMAALVHDLPEHITGDLPRWAKENLKLNIALQEMESKIYAQYDLNCDIDENERKWLKAVDLFDAWMFIRQNILAGNRLALDAYHRSTAAMDAMDLPSELAEVYDAIKWGDKL